MRIAQVAPLYERVPPALYGGTERVVSYLTEELARRGHDVTLFASGDSRTRARLTSAAVRAFRLDPDAGDTPSPHVIELAQGLERADEFDPIHCHVDYLALPFGRLVRTPTIHTAHGRLHPPHLVPVFRHFRDVPRVSISDAKRVGLPLRIAAKVDAWTGPISSARSHRSAITPSSSSWAKSATWRRRPSSAARWPSSSRSTGPNPSGS
jgi:glycosyltransferase involved in cell wall biosynthesis